ncbi:MAG: hypothetical protein IKV63_05300, partial [Clostridia bacterium]|nr:hypothetical protein [Clostridia bacterium]
DGPLVSSDPDTCDIAGCINYKYSEANEHHNTGKSEFAVTHNYCSLLFDKIITEVYFTINHAENQRQNPRE